MNALIKDPSLLDGEATSQLSELKFFWMEFLRDILQRHFRLAGHIIHNNIGKQIYVIF